MMIIKLFGIISECMIITYFLCKYFGLKHHNYAVVKASLFFIIIAIYDYASGEYISSEFATFGGFFILTFLFSFLFLKGNMLEKIATCALTFILIAAINLPILAISSAITNQYPDAILNSNDKTDVLILDTFLSKIIYFGVLQAILLFRKKEKIVLKMKEWIVIIVSFIISILIASLVRLLLITHSTQPFFYFLIALCLTALDLIILLFIIWVNRSVSIREENLQIKLRLEKQEKETKLINAKYEETSMLKHDFKKHLHNIDKLLDRNELDNARNYMKGLLEQQNDSLLRTVHSDQTILDSLINEKIQEAKEKRIDITCRLITIIPDELQMDVCSILTNLIDNAIENSPTSMNNRIIVIIQKSHGYYRITVKNNINHSVLKYNHDLHSKKTDGEQHGWGLKSVRRVAENHDGRVDVYEENDMFIVAVILQDDCSPPKIVT